VSVYLLSVVRIVIHSSHRFRRYLNLKPYGSFEEWNPDTETARAAELLYGHIENLELYPGLMAEVTKPAIPGSGVCPGQTTGRGILDDAVALVRGDRFLSYDFNSTTLTNWGFSKLGTLPPGAYGSMLPQLLFNGLPGAWTGTSSWALLPFYTPEAAKGILKQNKVIDQYDLERPSSDQLVIGIFTQEGCKKVFEDRENFRVMYQKAIRQCTAGHDFMIGWDEAKKHDTRSNILHKVFFEENFEEKLSQFFRTNVAKLIKDHSLKYSDKRRSIDIVRDVTNVTPILWLAEKFAIPLKTKETPHGILSVSELFMVYLVLFMYQSFNIIPVNEWTLRDGALKAGAALRAIFEAHLKTQQGVTEGIVDWLAKGSAFHVGPDADKLYHTLNDTKLPIGDMVGDCIGMGAPVAGNITQQASLLIDLFLSDGYEQYKERIIELSHKDDSESERELQGFVFEGMRHAGVVPGLPRVAAKDITIIDGTRGPVQIKAGHTILIATSKAAMDPVAFPDPEKLNPHRPFSDYILLGDGLHYCFGARMVGASLAATLKEVFKLKNIRRASGKHGYFSVVEHEFAGVKMRQYLDANAKESPIPTTLTLEYDDE
jgi:cytochrome P450